MKCTIAFVFAVVFAAACGATVRDAGEKHASPHITGGDPVNHFERAYSVRLRLELRTSLSVRFCGGARLDQYWIITAAECLDKHKYNRIQILYPAKMPQFDHAVDEYNFSNFQYIIHSDYNNVTKANNIALLVCRFCEPVPANSSLPLLPRLWEKYESFSHFPATVSGWSIDNKTVANQLERKIISFETHIANPFLCKLVYFFRSVRDEHICASSWFRKGISEAHVGVPLVIKEGSGPDFRVKLLGIASSIKPWSTTIPIPIIFTKITPYQDWISDQIRRKINYVSLTT